MVYSNLLKIKLHIYLLKLFLYIFINIDMKTFKEYISNVRFISEVMLYESETDMIVEGSFLKKLANWFGSTAGKITNKLREYQNDLVNFNKNVQTAFNGYAANSINDKSLSKETTQKHLDTITSVKPEEIPAKVVEIYNDNKNDPKYKASPSMAYLYLYALEIAKEKGDTENQKTLQDAFDSIPTDIKKQAAENLKTERSENKKNEEQTSLNNSESSNSEQTINPKEEPEKVEQVVDKVADEDEMTKLAQECGIKKLQELKEFVTQKLKDSGKEFNEQTVKDLLVIICNANKAQDLNKLKEISQANNLTVEEILNFT